MSAHIPHIELPSFSKLLAQLVAVPSISSPSPDWDLGNRALVEVLANWFTELGFKVEVMPVPGLRDKVNMIATLGQGSGGLVLSGHTDTVPYDAKRWQSDPFSLVEREGKLFGLGTCDMKGFFPIIIEALRGMDQAELSQPLIIVATADEESSMSGARALVEGKTLSGRVALIGEPTSIKPIRMHKGIMMQSISVTGRSGHSSNPALGNSAFEGMHELVAELLRLRDQLQRQHVNKLFEVAVPTMNFGRIHGGDSPNRICGHCELSFDVRPLPDMDMAELSAHITLLANQVAQRRGLQIEVRPLFAETPPFETPAHTELVKVCEQLTGQQAGAVAFATEAPYLKAMGFDTIILGAGSIDQAHQPNEFLALAQIKPMVQVLQGLISRYCIAPADRIALPDRIVPGA